MSGGLPITSANSRHAGAYQSYRAECFDLIEGYEEKRRAQAEVEVGDASARLERDGETFLAGCRELQALLQFFSRNTYVDGSLVQVHNETRALLLEGSVGYAVVFGKRTGRDLGPLGDLLLATHQLDWRLGERALAFSRLGDDLVEARSGAREVKETYVKCGEKALGAARASREELKRRNAVVEAKQKAYVKCKPARGGGLSWTAAASSKLGGGGGGGGGGARGDLWLAENELRVACQRAAQQQSHFSSVVAECEASVAALETWRDDQSHRLVDRFVRVMAVFRDDLARVGERLVKCGREAEFLRYTDFQAHVVKPRVDASKDLLETANETRDAQRERQAGIDATAKSKGALVFPPFPDDADFEDARDLVHWPTPDKILPPPEDRPAPSGGAGAAAGGDPRDDDAETAGDAAPRVSATAAAAETRRDLASTGVLPAIPTMPRTSLVAKKGVLEYEKSVVGAKLGWSNVYVVVTYDGFVHAFPGRTEGAVEMEDASFAVDLASAVVNDEEEGPGITISTRRSSMVAMLGNKEYHLRTKNAADKYDWLRAFSDPLALWTPPAEEAASDAPPITPASKDLSAPVVTVL